MEAPTIYRRVMVDLQAAVALHGFAVPDAPRPPSSSKELLAPGVVHVDYDDPDHVFRITVEEISRRHLTVPPTAMTQLADITVQLTNLVTDTHLSVQLEGIGAAADAVAKGHRRVLEEWAANYRPGSDPGAPPPWPADRLMAEVQVLVTDDVGTDYRFVSGAAGGDDTPWAALRRYLPAPPPSATVLHLKFIVAAQPDVNVTVPLPACLMSASRAVARTSRRRRR